MESRNSKQALARRFLSLSQSILVTAIAVVVLLALPSFAGEYKEHEARLNALASKMSALEKTIYELIEKREKGPRPDEMKALNQEIAKSYGELKKVDEDNRAEILHIRFKHPNRGDLAERKYLRYRIKSLEEMEATLGLEGRLDLFKDKVDHKYHMDFAQHRNSEEERKPASDDINERPVLRK